MIIKINTKYLLTFIKNIKNKGLVAYGACNLGPGQSFPRDAGDQDVVI